MKRKKISNHRKRLVTDKISCLLGCILIILQAELILAQEKNPYPLRLVMADSLVGWSAGFVQTGGYKQSAEAVARPARVPMILKTTNGGANWFLQTVLQSGNHELIVRDLQAVDAQHVRVLVSDESDEMHYLLMTDDGEIWDAVELNLPDVSPRFMSFVNIRDGLMIGTDMFDEDRLYRTNDGGKTWKIGGSLPQGRIEALTTDGREAWMVARKKENPASLVVLCSQDIGRSWIQVMALSAGKNENLIFQGIFVSSKTQMVFIQRMPILRSVDPQWVLYHSTDRFLSHQSFTVQSVDKQQSRNPVLFIANEDRAVFFSRSSTDEEMKSEEVGDAMPIHFSRDKGKKWQTSGIFRNAVSDAALVGSQRIVTASQDAFLWLSPDNGVQWTEGIIDFRDIFYAAGPPRYTGLSGLDEDILEDYEDHSSDQQNVFKWESEEDSLLAASLVSAGRSEKYKPDLLSPFSAGIESVTSTTVQFHKRVRWGAKHVPWDLITEEIKTGEIRIPRYKTIYLKGSVHHTGNARIQSYLWTSSINGELGREIELQTRPDQLSPGTHYIFFKALDEHGEWSKPAVIKITVEDFPKYKFPFYGRWMVGGGGSYYNQGRHIRGIRYALDLNYAEGGEGGDNDFGIPVRASTDGTVIFAGYTKGYGRNVRISYTYAGKNYMTLVSHLATISVQVGEKVRQGQELGTCGSTGRSSAPHIHWELRVNDVCVPPEPVFENDSTVVQTIRNGNIYDSDNIYHPEHILVVEEPDIPGTVLEYKGYNHSYRWCGISRVKTVEAKWKPQLPRSGLYKIQAHINRDHATAVVTYRIHTKNGIQEVKINQNKFTWEWATLGIFELDKDDDVYVTLSNESNQRKGALNFDAIRFVGMWEN